MKVHRLVEVPSTECLLAAPNQAEATCGFTSDLLSNIMGQAEKGSVLITIQAHQNTVAVASLVGSPAILVCSSRPVPDDMKAAAERENIGLFRTCLNQFEASVAVHQLLTGLS
jgi:hypothetical protein